MIKTKYLRYLALSACITVTSSMFVMCESNSSIKSNEGEASNTIVDEKNDGNKEFDENNDINKEQNKEKLKYDEEMMRLVNKENLLEPTYVPQELVLSEIEFLSYIETRNLSKVCADAAKTMFDAALEDGIKLLGASGYRSYDVQVGLYNSRVEQLGEEEASFYTAPPGASEHQTGLALDILGEDYQYLDDNFDQSESFKWLEENCYKYGFILRYLKGKEDITGFGYEPWHFRYIGSTEIAEEIMKNNLTLEEYLEKSSY